MTDRNVLADKDRRRFLRTGFGVMAACFSLPLWNLLQGCSGGQDEAAAGDEPLKLALALVPEGERTVVDYNGRPVELLRQGDGVTARSLLCTHQGCKVRWHEDRQLYICPCHEGKFDADGQVVYGMPRKPLPLVPAVVQDGQVIVGG
jgi:cytochrome b6-f complex iron-sulfur subunit